MARTVALLLAAAMALGAAGDPGQGHGGAAGGGARRRFVVTETLPPEQRCIGAMGGWCTGFHSQTPVPWKPAPRGDTDCPDNCNGVGVCNYDTGYCDCPAGWTGLGCKEPQKRPCTDRKRSPDDITGVVLGHIDADGRDLNWTGGMGATPSRCLGICDDDIAMCWCDGPMGRVPAPPGSPPGTPPLRRGRPMSTYPHQPNSTKDGQPVTWGGMNYNDLFGPEGWCVKEDTKVRIGTCVIDGLVGPTCDEVVESFCTNQCNGHGECNLGFCKCDPGWYGHDCARKRAGLPLEPSRILTQRWLNNTVIEARAALEPPPAPTRKRPLIYVYDLEPLFNTKLLQLRVAGMWCAHRTYKSGNVTSWTGDNWGYAADNVVHEALLQSDHRTFDPEEADFFYVPQYSSCYFYPIFGWADWPWFAAPGQGLRVAHGANMVQQTKDWIAQHYPFWNRTGGRDHVWTFTHDEGACWAPNDVAQSIFLTHWGRLGLDHTSNTAHAADNYTHEEANRNLPEGWTHLIKGHACYNTDKDLVLPSFKSLDHYVVSPLIGRTPGERDILLFFKGDVGKKREPHYSRGVRQRLYRLSQEGEWRKKHNVTIGARDDDIPGSYSENLARSRFCLTLAGDGYSARAEDAILHGCIPVVIQDGVHQTLESALDWSTFSVRIPEAEVHRTLEILLALPDTKVRAMQVQLSRVWHRFRYVTGPGLATMTRGMLRDNLQEHARQRKEALEAAAAAAINAADTSTQQLQDTHLRPLVRLPRPFRGDPTVDDAFSTILQWLHSKVDTRGARAGRAPSA